MSRKKKTPTSTSASYPALKIGSRVRCTDDGVEGRITWANSVAVKIQWDDGEQVTWRRDALAGRPIEILAEHGDEEPSAAPATDGHALTEPSEPAALKPASASPADPTEMPVAVTSAMAPAADTPADIVTPAAAAAQVLTPPDPKVGLAETPAATAPKPRTHKPKQADNGSMEKRLSALDAAVLVLAETAAPMTCQELIAVMSAYGYWTSPAGRTPEATLYSAMAREITTKGVASRFVKVGRGLFALAQEKGRP